METTISIWLKTHHKRPIPSNSTRPIKPSERSKKRVEWGLQMRAKSKEWKTRYDHWLRDYEKNQIGNSQTLLLDRPGFR